MCYKCRQPLVVTRVVTICENGHIDDFRDEIKLKLTGDLLESELDDDTLNKIIKSALRELQRYINYMVKRLYMSVTDIVMK